MRCDPGPEAENVAVPAETKMHRARMACIPTAGATTVRHVRLSGVVRNQIPFARLVKSGDPVIPDAANVGVGCAVIWDESDYGAVVSFSIERK